MMNKTANKLVVDSLFQKKKTIIHTTDTHNTYARISITRSNRIRFQKFKKNFLVVWDTLSRSREEHKKRAYTHIIHHHFLVEYRSRLILVEIQKNNFSISYST